MKHILRVNGGLMVGPDGRVHTTFNDNPSTLRWGSENPNMQNLPRTKGGFQHMVKGMFVAPPGFEFVARDYTGIESVLVGYFSGAQGYTRVSLIDPHSFVTAWALYELERKLTYADLPQLSWSDADLTAYLHEFKPKYPDERQGIKHMGHSTNYMAGAKRTQEVLFDELGVMVDLKKIKKFKAFYFELFPEIPVWHANLATAVDGTRPKKPLKGQKTGAGYVRNPYGVMHRFYEVVKWTKVYGKWEWSFGDPAKALIAFPPQSSAAGIGKEALIRVDEYHPEIAEGLRLFIHDELLGEWRLDQREEVLYTLKLEMEKPNPEFPLDPEWGMGEFLAIKTEGKAGNVWGEMHEVKD